MALDEKKMNEESGKPKVEGMTEIAKESVESTSSSMEEETMKAGNDDDEVGGWNQLMGSDLLIKVRTGKKRDKARRTQDTFPSFALVQCTSSSYFHSFNLILRFEYWFVLVGMNTCTSCRWLPFPGCIERTNTRTTSLDDKKRRRSPASASGCGSRGFRWEVLSLRWKG